VPQRAHAGARVYTGLEVGHASSMVPLSDQPRGVYLVPFALLQCESAFKLAHNFKLNLKALAEAVALAAAWSCQLLNARRRGLPRRLWLAPL
jgi:hypothetical protein